MEISGWICRLSWRRPRHRTWPSSRWSTWHLMPLLKKYVLLYQVKDRRKYVFGLSLTYLLPVFAA
jgi:hypothetical protein